MEVVITTGIEMEEEVELGVVINIDAVPANEVESEKEAEQEGRREARLQEKIRFDKKSIEKRRLRKRIVSNLQCSRYSFHGGCWSASMMLQYSRETIIQFNPTNIRRRERYYLSTILN